LAKLTNIGIESKVLERPSGVVNWVYSDTSDTVSEIHITNFVKDHHGSFGFWVHGDTYEEAAKKAIGRLLTSLKWSYKVRIKKWLE
jgi:hypothetical protein